MSKVELWLYAGTQLSVVQTVVLGAVFIFLCFIVAGLGIRE